MTLDTASLRVAFAVVALTLTILFYFADFRSTRSGYSGWWSIGLLLFLLGSAAFLLDRTALAWWSNPAGNALVSGGASSIWASSRSLRALPARPFWFAAGPVLAGVASGLDNPMTNPWAGDPIFLGVMCVMIGLGARELWLGGSGISKIRRSMAMAAAAVAAFYLVRLLVFLADGPRGQIYGTYFGSEAMTLVGMAFLAVASFSMFALSSENRAGVLRAAAARDGLTGLLNRNGFLEAATTELRSMRLGGREGTLILADLDYFKAVNDTYGHAAGDAALKAFGEATMAAVRSSDLVGRLGGEEFILLLPGVSSVQAQSIVAEISARLESLPTPGGMPMPTASYGIVTVDDTGADLARLIGAADVALYRAKNEGRNRAVIATQIS